MLAEPHPGKTSPRESSLGVLRDPPRTIQGGPSSGSEAAAAEAAQEHGAPGAAACGWVPRPVAQSGSSVCLSAGNPRRGPRSTRQSRPPSWNPCAPPGLCPGLWLKRRGQERGLVGTGGADGPWGCPGRSLRPSGWLPCCAADLGPEGVPRVSSPAAPPALFMACPAVPC